jgi:uncharacterized membrane protein
MMEPGPMTGVGLFFVVWFFMMAGFTIGWIIFLIALWRGMKAHEAIAEHLKRLVAGQPGGPRP